MGGRQDLSGFSLQTRWVGGLPLVNAILQRPKVLPLLEEALPATGGHLSHAQALGVLLRNIVLNDRQPIYTHGEWAARAEPQLIGLEENQARLLNDDPVGRALDRLFDADRASLLTQLVLGAIRVFAIDLDQPHNDSTTLSFSGQYRSADRGRGAGETDAPHHLRVQQVCGVAAYVA